MSRYLSTQELERYIKSMYAKVKPYAKRDGVYQPLQDYFAKGLKNQRDESYCYADDEGYHFRGVGDRGGICETVDTKSLKEITYRVLKETIFWMAVEYECQNRIEGQDFRRMMFAKRLEYWNAIDPEFAMREKERIDEILERAPFED